MVGSDDAIHGLIDFLVDHLTFGVGIVPGHDLARTLHEGDGSHETGYGAFDLGVVEDHAVGLVADQPRAIFWGVGGDEVGGDVDGVEFHPGRVCKDLVNLVPTL